MATLAAILCIIIFAPLAMGSVYIVTYSLMGGIVFAALGVHFAKRTFGDSQDSQKWGLVVADKHFLVVIIPFALFLLVGFFQIIPLPAWLLRFMSPGTSALYGKLGIDRIGMLPLTVSTALTASALLNWCCYGGLIVLLATWNLNIGSREDQRWLLLPAYAIFAIGLIESVYGLYSAVNHSESLFWFTRTRNVGIVSGTYINPDHLAGLFDMAIPISMGLFFYHGGMLLRRYGHSARGIVSLLGSKRSLGIWFLFLGIVIMILAHIYTLSRMGHISIIFALALMIILYSRRRLKTPIVGAMTLLLAGGLWAVWDGLGSVTAKWTTFQNSFQGRYDIWKGALSLFINSPIAGTGLGTFRLAYPQYKATVFNAAIYDHAHNDYLEILTDTGLIGFVPWIVFFCLFLCFVTRDWFRNESFLAKTVGAGCIAGVIAALLHSLADFNLQIPANAAILFIIMGITWRIVARDTPSRHSATEKG